MRLTILLHSLILLIIFSCAKKTESDLFDAAMALDEPSERIESLTDFLRQYPQSDKKSRIYYRLFSDYCTEKNENLALEYAGKYLSQYPPDGRMQVYNSVAWILAENDLASDSAVIYAHRAVKLAEESNYRGKNLILDTYAFALYKNGQHEAAREIQKKALVDNADNPEYLGRMADYQFESGNKQEGIRSLLKSLLFSGRTTGYQKLNKWLVVLEPDKQKRNQLKLELVRKEIDEYLKSSDSPLRQSRAALMLAFTDIDKENALQLAQSAMHDNKKNLPISERSILSKNLARIYEARGEFDKMLGILNDVRIYIPAYDTEFWLSLGSAFEKTGQNAKALDAYVAGLIWRKDQQLQQAANALLDKNESLDNKIAAVRASELNFEPGKFDEKSPTSSRTVLAELFTGAECSPCVASDLAFDHLAEYFPQDRVLILEYHCHIPGPDPLTNKMSEARYAFYGSDFGTPTVFIDGTQKLVGGGPDIVQRVKFYEYRDEIKKLLSEVSAFTIGLNANRWDDIVSVEAVIKPVTNPKSDVRYFLALVERSVDYTGRNGIKKHAFVVRHLFDGPDGYSLDFDSGEMKISSEINLNDIEQNLQKYLDDFVKNPPARFRGFTTWQARPDKLNRDNLLIISWIQDFNTKKVYQAAYQDL